MPILLDESENKNLRLRDVFNNESDFEQTPGYPDFAQNATQNIYVDSTFTGSVKDGSRMNPFSSLVVALTTLLTESNTVFYQFFLAPGTYTGSINIQRSTATQSFVITGSGANCTFIESGNTFISGKDSDVIYLRNFLDVKLEKVTIRNGKYGLYVT